MDFLTRDIFDALVIVVIVIGLALAAIRFYRDVTRPIPGDANYRPRWSNDDTQPRPPVDSEAPPSENGAEATNDS